MNKLKILITIDTEVWSFYGDDIDKNISSAMYGITEEGEYGLNHQLEMFNEFNLNATFFLEPFFTLSSGESPLVEIVESINSFGQEIGLHVHTEWFCRSNVNNAPVNFNGDNIKDYSLVEQSQIIKSGLNLLIKSGAKDICSFRAGNYGANNDTLKALHMNNISFDTSYNRPYLETVCDIKANNFFTQPISLEGIIEFPITHFQDYPNHLRHLQVTACSMDELKFVINQLWTEQQEYCVVVLHSFEWITRKVDSKGRKQHKLDKTCLSRFRGFCEYLHTNNDRFETVKFADLKNESFSIVQTTPVISNIFRTGKRIAQQAMRRFI